MAETLLIVEDEPDVVELLAYHLERAGYRTESAADGVTALEKARELLPALVLLDLMLPGHDGTEVCKRLRADPKTAGIPILMLTARAEEIDRILGLEPGADDYVTKPFSPREVVLRVRTILRRARGLADPGEVRRCGEIVLDQGRHCVEVKGRALELTATEFRLLATLMERRGRVQTRGRLLADVWGYTPDTDTRTVDTHMRRLREKLGRAARHIETVRGIGYRMVDPR